MIGLLVVALLSTAHAQLTSECPPDSLEVATYRHMTRNLGPISIPNRHRMAKDVTYAVPELQTALSVIEDFGTQLRLPEDYLTDPFVERCCEKPNYNCSSISIELRYIKYRDGMCWIVWPERFFVYTRCTCCTCLLNDNCPVVGRCVETDFVTIKVIAYCAHIMYSDRYQKLAMRIPTSCQCAASCPLPQNYFYKKAIKVW